MRLLALAGVAFWLVLPANQAAQADGVDNYIKNQMERHRIPGVALKVIQDGKTAKIAAYGLANLELNVPVSPETVFEIGSITKQFTAASILLLAQEGKLSVDDNISKYLSDTPEAWKNVTIRHLLTHTSGIKSYTGLDGFQMWSPVRLNDGKTRNYGFGWSLGGVEGHKNIGHSGSTSGFSASIQRFPDDKLAVIILTNTDEEIATTLARKIAGFYFKEPVAAK
jgi:CubicO group peptidase (beta-lactamase class C family)